MKTIKQLWNKIKAFFANLLGKKKVKVKIEEPTLDKEVEQVFEAPQPMAPVVKTAEEINGEIFDSILKLSKEHHYFLSDALAAYNQGDTIGLKRIEKQMKDGTYENKENVSEVVKRFRMRQLAFKKHRDRLAAQVAKKHLNAAN